MNYRLVYGEQVNLRDEYPVSSLKNRLNHTYIVGKTGMGKSTLMERMIYNDIMSGFPVIFIDPKGESADRLYSLFKDNPKVRYVSFKKPMVINPIQKQGYEIDILIAEFIQILNVLITLTSPNPESTVRMKDVLYNSLKYFSEKDFSLEFLVDFLHFSHIRDNYNFGNSKINQWWKELLDPKKSGFTLTNDYLRTMNSLESRIHMFIQNNEMKQFILGENEFLVEDIVSNNKSILVNCESPIYDNQIFLANLFFYSVYSYLHKSLMKPLFVYVDEFNLVASEFVSLILQTARSKFVGFTMTHQYFESLDYKILESIMSVVDNLIGFRMGDKEAKRMATHFNVPVGELINLPKYRSFVKTDLRITLVDIFPPLETQKEEELNFLKEGWI